MSNRANRQGRHNPTIRNGPNLLRLVRCAVLSKNPGIVRGFEIHQTLSYKNGTTRTRLPAAPGSFLIPPVVVEQLETCPATVTTTP